jgi:peptidoglycan/LPS O-acetylase OafA/YrhL
VIQLKYRPDIDGLRAIAVLSVVIYHAFPWMIPGGFTGVDIFFVISGYLISGILYKGLKANGGAGNFSFGEFYARRVRRLFPALITVLLATMAYGWLILLPDEFQQMGKHVAAGTLFIQNIVFWQESGYFDIAASLKPLLHLWSLAVEEQFYIFFPPILLLIWKKKWPLAAIMGVLLIASMIGNLVMSGHGGTAAFFLTPYRAWEFLGGSLLAWWHYERGHEEEVPPYREALSWGGALLLALGMAFIRTGDPYPGWRALLPVAGTLLLMEGGAGTGVKGAWVNRKILSNPAVVWVGLISYPLYLFHWPALSFVHIIKGENPKPGYIVAALGVSLLLTILTYYFIEKKIRRNTSKWVLPALVVSFVAVGVIGHVAWRHGLYPRAESDDIYVASKDWRFPFKMQKLSSTKHVSIVREGHSKKTTLFLGDSDMQQYGSRITKLIKEGGDSRSAIFVTSLGCPPIPDIKEKTLKGTDELIPEFYRIINSIEGVDRVVIAANWVWYIPHPNAKYEINGKFFPSHEAMEDAFLSLHHMIQDLVKRRILVYLILNIPVDKKQDPKSEISRNFMGFNSKKMDLLSISEFDNQYGDFLKRMKIEGEASGAKVIDPREYLSIGNVYPRAFNGVHIYKDGWHFRDSYVREHVKYLDETVAP